MVDKFARLHKMYRWMMEVLFCTLLEEIACRLHQPFSVGTVDGAILSVPAKGYQIPINSQPTHG